MSKGLDFLIILSFVLRSIYFIFYSSEADDAEALAADYLKNMGNGKKNLLCGDFPEAVACFQLACSQQ